MVQAATSELMDLGVKRIVRSGPQLYVSRLIYKSGQVSTAKIWDEIQRDTSIDREMFSSKTFLKNRVLHVMEKQGKIKKARAIDMPKYKHGGWKLNESRAFRNVSPDILSQLDPIPKLDRDDYKEYLRVNNIPHKF